MTVLFWIVILIVIIFNIVFNIVFLLFLFYDMTSKVFFVPSEKRIISQLFKTYHFEKGKKFVDLGSGTGRVVFEAQKNGLISYGYELNPILYLYCLFVKKIKRIENCHFIRKDFFKADLSEYDYIYLYLLPTLLKKLEPKILSQAKKGTKIISLDFPLSSLEPKEIILNRFFIYEI